MGVGVCVATQEYFLSGLLWVLNLNFKLTGRVIFIFVVGCVGWLLRVLCEGNRE